MIVGHQTGRFLRAKVLIGCMLTILLAYVSLSVADHDGTPQIARYVIAPGFVIGMHFASGRGFLGLLGSFGRIALTVNILYYGLISFFLLRKIK